MGLLGLKADGSTGDSGFTKSWREWWDLGPGGLTRGPGGVTLYPNEVMTESQAVYACLGYREGTAGHRARLPAHFHGQGSGRTGGWLDGRRAGWTAAG